MSRLKGLMPRTATIGVLTVLVVFACMFWSSSGARAESQTAKIVNAANAFLGTLDQTQREAVLFAFNDEQQRVRWSNLPVGAVPRAGIGLKDMNDAQRSAAMALLSSALSPKGFEKVQEIMDGDEINKTTDTGRGPGGGRGRGRGPGGPPPDNGGNPPAFARGGNPPPFGRGGSGGAMFGKDLYYISILGTPSEKNPWMLQFGGHHLAVNITIAGEQGILTPTLTGAQPAKYTLNGKTIRPLAGESDKAIALLNALDEDQKKQAILGFRLVDLVLGPGQDGKTIQPEGLKASGMTEKQRAMLLDVISEWAGIVHESAASARMVQLKSDINDTWFAWSGPTTVVEGSNITAYYRIQGPHLVIEYAPQTLGGDPALHVHTMYRDPTNDYGRKAGAK
jgi:Protein of unknown function (DUF3500)